MAFGDFLRNFGFSSFAGGQTPALPQMNTISAPSPLISPISGMDTGNVPMTGAPQPPVPGAMSPLIGSAMDRMTGGKAGSLSWVGPKATQPQPQPQMAMNKPTSASQAVAAGAKPNITPGKVYTNADLPPIRTLP